MVYFSHHIYNRFVETLNNMNLTTEQRAEIKANICAITEYDPNRIRVEESFDDPKERARIQKQMYTDKNREVIRERSRIHMRNKRLAARLAQEQQTTSMNTNGGVMV